MTERAWDLGDKPFLLTLRDEGDPPADQAIAARDTVWAPPAELRGDTADTAGWIDDHFGADRPTRPDWVDDELLRRGQDFFGRQPWAVNIAFLLGSLPMSYGAAAGAGVLEQTGTLVDAAERRIFETALLIEELTEPGGLDDGMDGRPLGRGYVTILRLRLLHAAVRRTVLDEGWDAEAMGCPISQLDLLGTLWCFSLSSAHALDLAGRDVDDDEVAGWVHLWCLIGHHLGIRPDLLPMGVEEARRCFEAIQWVQFGPSAAGRDLMKALIRVGHDLVPLERYDQLVEALIRRNIGDAYAEMLEVEDVGTKPLDHAEWFWHRLTDEEPADGDPGAVDRLAERLLLGICRHLADEDVPDRRSPEANRRLLDIYDVRDLLDLPERAEEARPGFADVARRPRAHLSPPPA
jgi:hypothetical protein